MTAEASISAQRCRLSGDTIFAPATPPGKSALAVIRISGPHAVAALEGIAGRIPDSRQAVLRTLRHPATRAPIDQALVIFFKGPATETGEDIVEFQIHGSRAVLAAMLGAIALIPGCRLAEPGEFARRAFYNGKLDLTAIEGIADLIDAETEGQRAQALAQAGGALDKTYGRWREGLVEAQALVEAAIDFADENDVAGDAVAKAAILAAGLLPHVEEHLANCNRGEILRSGFKVVLAGPPNAGKSSLLNALARRDVAIVSPEPGTTRDVIEVRLDLGGLPVLISDTAGIREPGGEVEREGIRRSVERARVADLVVWLDERGAAPPADLVGEGIEVIGIQSKVDVCPTPERGGLVLSVVTDEGIDVLTSLIAERAKAKIGDVTSAVPTQARHHAHLARAAAHLRTFLTADRRQLELRAEDLRLAATELGRLTGRIDPEEVLGAIFGRFCIGK